MILAVNVSDMRHILVTSHVALNEYKDGPCKINSSAKVEVISKGKGGIPLFKQNLLDIAGYRLIITKAFRAIFDKSEIC